MSDPRTLWSERESMYDLMLLRATIGEGAFNSEKQNLPTDPSLCEWPESYFDWPGFWFDCWPDRLTVKTIGIDPSKGKDARKGDYSAIVKYGRDARGVEYVEADLARRPVDAICAAVASHCLAFEPDAVLLEANAWQDLLAQPMREAMAAAGAGACIPHIALADNTAPKPVRIRRLTGPLAQRKMRFKARSPGTMLLVEQMRDFPAGEHDDGPDAAELARRIAIEILNGRQQKRR